MSDWRSLTGAIFPDWPAPRNVCALATNRAGGVSIGNYAGLNLGGHVGDDPSAVEENRRRLAAVLPASPVWLNQVHGIEVQLIGKEAQRVPINADASLTRTPEAICAIQTADCLPVLFCDVDGTVVAAAHAGWRGLCEGVLEATLAAMQVDSSRIMAWMGPAIGPNAFVVGAEVRDAFVAVDVSAARAFSPSAQTGKWMADIFLLARLRLWRAGLTSIYGGGVCTVSDPARFFSHRRDRVSGRQASLIWLDRAGD